MERSRLACTGHEAGHLVYIALSQPTNQMPQIWSKLPSMRIEGRAGLHYSTTMRRCGGENVAQLSASWPRIQLHFILEVNAGTTHLPAQARFHCSQLDIRHRHFTLEERLAHGKVGF